MTAVAAAIPQPSAIQPFSLAVLPTALGPIECAETGEGPAVLCLHGAMGGYDQGLILGRTVGEPGYRFLAPSRPGYLRTPLSGRRSPEAQADLYAAMLDTLGVRRTAVIAVSGGGPSAIHFALRHPGRCWGLVLVSTVATVTPNRLPWSFTLMGLLARVPWVAAAMARGAMKDPEGAARRSITDPVLFERTRRDTEAWGLLMELQASTTTGMAARMAGTKNDVALCRTQEFPLERITTPTLIVHGTNDPLVPIARHGQVSARRIPGAELVPLEGGEHAAIFSHRAEARTRVTAFLRAQAVHAAGASGA